MSIPLSLDDIRIGGPDRDNEDAFDPAATWAAARGFAEGGYLPEDVADVLAGLESEDNGALADWLANHPEERGCPLYSAWVNWGE